ncbi:hypothetical protein P4O66_018199, partial [Electrophorus voltai]
MESVEKECGALGGLFQTIVNDMKNSYPVWEDFGVKATKLHSQLRNTVLVTAAFLDAFQKVADMATNARANQRTTKCPSINIITNTTPNTPEGVEHHWERLHGGKAPLCATLKLFQVGGRRSRVVQNGAGRSRVVQSGTERSGWRRVEQGGAGWSRVEEGGAEWRKVEQGGQGWRISNTLLHSGSARHEEAPQKSPQRNAGLLKLPQNTCAASRPCTHTQREPYTSGELSVRTESKEAEELLLPEWLPQICHNDNDVPVFPGATRDVGSALTRMCMRQRSIEAKLRHFTNALMDKLIMPLQDKVEEWKKSTALLDKDHAKEYKRSRQEIKKKSSDTLKLQKKARKGRGGLQPQLDSAKQDVSDMYLLMEETEKQAVRRALLEERGRYCTFIGFLQPVVNGEIAMLGEVTHLQAITDDLTVLATDPHKLPDASEQVILDLKCSDYSWSYQTPPSSPSSAGSRKNSLNSLVHPPPGGAHRLGSVSSHDSGFNSQDANVHSKPPSPMPSDITSQVTNQLTSLQPHTEVFQLCVIRGIRDVPDGQRVQLSHASKHGASYEALGQDWSKGPLSEQSGALLQHSSDATASPSGVRGNGVMRPEEPYRAKALPAHVPVKHGKPMVSAASELAMVLTRGLSLEQQKSSCDSLQYSSGYNTQTTTPSCSEDAIPYHGSDYDSYFMNGDADTDARSDFDKSCTVPRNSNLAQNYRRMIQTKRPASTAGIPGGLAVQGVTNGRGRDRGVISSGTATIRRTPSSKTGLRRTPSNVGPIPIRSPIIPVRTPTAPASPSFPAAPPQHNSSEESLYSDESLEVQDYKASPQRMSLPSQAWGPGAVALSSEEDQLLAANRHTLVEKIGELVASARALGDGQSPFTANTQISHQMAPPPAPPPAAVEGEDILKTIRRGVRLRKTVCSDRSAPRIT